MTKVTPNYVEMKAVDLMATKTFYTKALGFKFTDYGPEYAAVEGGPVQLGFASGEEPAAPMPTFETDNLEAALNAVEKAGGAVKVPIFVFPGGRRFQFLDPSGNEVAIYQADS
ncbi:VOC family protein [Sphingorhabdus sp. Alg239-R122]|uniref:VOC family protein n=1 Tax=Sphingorhabdus sp. Alg239-R122 TaxID=2305989 RepID=UPI0013DD67BC|nr:VOC family protein [Sphingorhabdus sp. Alg239-R122]